MGASPGYVTSLIAGVDEAGRGPIAGPVFAAAVILDPDRGIEGLADSKILGPEVRERLAGLIEEHAMSWGLGRAEIDEIDRLNILQATQLGHATGGGHSQGAAETRAYRRQTMPIAAMSCNRYRTGRPHGTRHQCGIDTR